MRSFRAIATWAVVLLPGLLLSSGACLAQSIEGRVTAAGKTNAVPVPGAQVKLARAGADASHALAVHTLTTATDADGNFRFLGLEAGDYAVTVEREGYYAASYSAALKPRQTLALKVELTLRETLATAVEVKSSVIELDPGQTGTSRVVTHEMIEEMPAPLRKDVPTLALQLAPGAVLSHDNFVHVRGNELSLHEFINGVSFLDNSHQHFTPGVSPEIFGSASIVTGGFAAEYGNRFGGVLDVTTRSGRDLGGHGSVSLGLGTVENHDGSADYGGSSGRWGYYIFGGGFSSDRFLNPPQPDELHDFGYGLRGAGQLDYQAAHDNFKLLVTGGSTRFELPNLTGQQLAGRDAERDLDSQTAILNWQHTFSPKALVSSSVYERTVFDRLRGTHDPITEVGDGGRSTLTLGVKSDVTFGVGRHTIKSGVDVSRLRLAERFHFDPQLEPVDIDPFDFRGGISGGEVALYIQDHFTFARHFTVDAGLRWDQFDLVDTFAQISPRIGIAYHVEKTGTVLHAAYNRFFSPPPIEYLLIAAYLGSNAADPALRVGDPKAYRQHYFEVGVTQQAGANVILEVDAYTHYGDNSFENSELGNTRLFVPTNFSHARAQGLDFSVNLRRLESIGLSARLQYSAARVYFVGPISGGFADEDLPVGERIAPAFDQRHTGTASLYYHRARWRDLWSGANFSYGSGTPSEGVRLPQHFTADVALGFNLWHREPRRLDFEFDATNVSDNRYAIAKESELTPVQYAPRRVLAGRLKWRF